MATEKAYAEVRAERDRFEQALREVISAGNLVHARIAARRAIVEVERIRRAV